MYIDYRIVIYGCIAYIHYVYICTIHTYAYIEQKIWGCRLVKRQFSQLVSAYGRFQGNLFIIRGLQICEKLYDVRLMLCLIFPYKVFLSSLQ